MISELETQPTLAQQINIFEDKLLDSVRIPLAAIQFPTLEDVIHAAERVEAKHLRHNPETSFAILEGLETFEKLLHGKQL